MRIQMHDFSGHPFQAELSRELAARGHFVDHVYSTQYGSGKGTLERTAADSDRLTFSPLTADTPFQKYSAMGRIRFERSYAVAWQKHIRATAPDCIVACNVPLFTLADFRRAAARRKQPWLLWHQDLFSNAISEELSRRLPGPAAFAGRALVRRMEAKVVRSATQVVAIGEEFRQAYRLWGLATDHVTVIPNWAPLDEITPRPRENAWSARHLPAGPELRLLYAGTLGRKHNPLLLAGLLRSALAAGLPARLVVASEGDGIEMLREDVGREPELPVTLLPFQPAAELPDMLGSADVLVTILEPGASRFSIPSKVLSSLAAGRPILGLMPDDNPAAADIRSADGFVGPPTDFGVAGGVGWLRRLHGDPAAVLAAGAKGRELAESRFGIGPITDRFEAALRRAAPGLPEPADLDTLPRLRPAHAAAPRGFLRKVS
ncbi:glycosyltransferase family 4 protein [Arthrobacter sp. zg-Y820]|uniref:glycosyltransferase family 4 protein n=1 Tax=unclassified Arthrobacter TaxID=235627 RepID=UPI002540D05F|nr:MULTISPECIES: glycosyltransferase family 4 protein [unclassified Arthrobacter]MCC9197990.1 glycosyltransferase family 4 protein [Arthrobacter sp. zg-Y820]MDK1280857.1 glycosyltransferase family 4 protein [Arthrobacter sp. zg.Y820]WIB10336.1 glycosyltransferase family 4 protein [Arthrobacter sp. zg-Y820]